MAAEWRLFEEAVARFLQALDPNARVRHNVHLPDRQHGRRRQRDVWIDAVVCGQFPISILISCKRYKRKLNSTDIDHFFGELHSSRAVKGIVYSASGFNEAAIEKAKELGIECCRLYVNQPADIPEAIFLPTFCSLPQYTMGVTGDFKSRGFRLWGELLSYVPHDGSQNVAELLASELWRHAQANPTNVLFPQPVITTLNLSAASGEPPILGVKLMQGWVHYRGRVEAYILDGSYCITQNNFRGSQHGPVIDTHHPPGPGWTLMQPEEVAKVNYRQAIRMSLVHSNESLPKALLPRLMTTPITSESEVTKQQ